MVLLRSRGQLSEGSASPRLKASPQTSAALKFKAHVFIEVAKILLGGALLIVVGCQPGPREGVYTLYRDSAIPSPKAKAMRIHIAIFDAHDGDDYNQENCQV